MAVTRTFSYPSSAGDTPIYATEWAPEAEPRAVLQVIHGISEHVERYAPLAEFLTAHGVLVVGADHLGHGRSAGERPGHFADRDGWRHVLADIHTLRRNMGETHPDVPYFMLGHSMGSFLLRHYLIDHPADGLAGAILSGTGQESPVKMAVGHAAAAVIAKTRGAARQSRLLHQLSLGAYSRAIKNPRTRADWISRDETVVDAYLADPYCRYRATAGLMRDLTGGLLYIAKPKHCARMNRDLPLYLCSGGQDPVGAMGAGVTRVARLFRDAGCRDVTVKLYPGGRHEILNEINRDEVLADLFRWLDVQIEREASK